MKNYRSAFLDIIRINESIINNKIDQCKPRSTEMTEGYNTHIKPLLERFSSNHKKSPRVFLKDLLGEIKTSDPRISIKHFGNWGIKVYPYIWATFYADNTNSMPASYTMQLYILVDQNGIKFGLDYGNEVGNNDSCVQIVRDNKEIQKNIVTAINKHNLQVQEIEPGSPDIDFNFNFDNNLIKSESDFSNWNNKIHLIKTFSEDEIDDSIYSDFKEVIEDLLPILSATLPDDIQIDESRNFWLYQPGRNGVRWKSNLADGVISIDHGYPFDLNQFSTKDQLDETVSDYIEDEGSLKNRLKGLWDFSKEMKIGDVVIAKLGRSKYLGYGVVESGYTFQIDDEPQHKRKVKWLNQSEKKVDGKLPVKTLTNITDYTDYVDKLKDLYGIQNGGSHKEEVTVGDDFNWEYLLKDIFLPEKEFTEIIDVLNFKKNIILEGPPGVGKTFIARKIAYGLQEEISDANIEVVQFHQSYSYEDFIQGYRPDGQGFSLRNGIFYDLCQRARKDISRPYFMIIDEINRGNLSKIFGELLMLIEADKRGAKNEISLTYSDKKEKFSVPSNVFIIGTMNTADRSLTIVDYALRRRFSFIKLLPSFNNRFSDFLSRKKLSDSLIQNLIHKIQKTNMMISEDESLGDGFMIGHSYFCNYSSGNEVKWLDSIIRFEVLPLIREYWFDDPDKARDVESIFD